MKARKAGDAAVTAATNIVPVTVSWTGSSAGLQYELQQSVNSGAFQKVALPSATATSVNLNLIPTPSNKTGATTYRFQVKATDPISGLSSTFTVGQIFQILYTDNSFDSKLAGSWSGQNVAGAFNGSVHFSNTAGANVTLAKPGAATGFALVSSTGPGQGKVNISVDGQVVATNLDLAALSTDVGRAQVVWSVSDLAAGVTHNVQVTVVSGRVDYDAILTMR
jgi:hypothetical protein